MVSDMARCFVIAEAGVNHNGDLDKALALVDAAAAAGADAVKFQTFRSDEIISPGTAKAAYQEAQTGAGDQYEMIRALELDENAHAMLAERCAQNNIEFMSTPFDNWAISLLTRLGMRRIKIASGELTNKPLLQSIAGQGLPMILSTGMGTLEEVQRAVKWLAAAWPREAPSFETAITILHCTSNYPAAASDVNLAAMITMRDALALPVGYSDHTLGTEISIAAVALGATVIEKHFTLDRNLPGPDHKASLSPEDLAAMVAAIRHVEIARGDGVKKPRPDELPVRALVRRSAFARRLIQAGEIIQADAIVFLRPGDGLGPERVDEIVGRPATRAIAAGVKLAVQDLG